jgi:hypothetical protein
MVESLGRCLVKVLLGPSVSSALSCVPMRRQLGSVVSRPRFGCLEEPRGACVCLLLLGQAFCI